MISTYVGVVMAFNSCLGRLFFDRIVGNVSRRARALAAIIDWSDWMPGKPTVLYLDRALFRKDVEEMKFRTQINFVGIGTTELKRSIEPWVPPEAREQTYFTHFLDLKFRYLKQPLEDFGVAFLKAASSAKRPIDAVMTGNTDYWQDEAIKLGCKRLGIPFLVLARENYVTGYDYTMVTDRMADAKFTFQGNGVAVFSDISRRTLESTGAFPKNSITVTGAPRFDRWADITEIEPADRTLIILLSYAAPLYMGQQNFRDVALIFGAAAQAAPSRFQYLIKVKKRSDAELVYKNTPELRNLPVHVVWDTPLYELFPRARAVIGYNTLAALEGLLAGVPVIVPSWSDAKREKSESLIYYDDPVDKAVIYFPDSADAFKDLLDRAATGSLAPLGTTEERRAAFNQRVYLPDEGSSSQMVEKFILSHIRKTVAS